MTIVFFVCFYGLLSMNFFVVDNDYFDDNDLQGAMRGGVIAGWMRIMNL